MRDLREGTAATVQVGQIVGPGGVTDARSIVLSGTSAYIYKGVAQATGVSTLMDTRNWEHSHIGFYQLEIQTGDTDITGPLYFSLGSSHPVTFLGIWETFNVMDANTFDAKYGDDNLKVMTTSGVTMDSGVTLEAGVVITSGVSIKPGIYSGVTLAGVSNVVTLTPASIWANANRSLTSGVTMDSGVTLNAGVVMTSGVSIKPGIYSGVTLAGVSNVLNATLDITSGVSIKPGIYSGVTIAGVSNVLNLTPATVWANTNRSLTSGVTMDSGVTLNEGVVITSGVSIKPGIYSGVTLAGVSNVLALTPVTIWANTNRSLTSGVTMDSGVTLEAGVVMTSGVSIKPGIYSGVTIAGVSNVLNASLDITSGVSIKPGIYSGVTIAGVSNVLNTDLSSGVSIKPGIYSGVTLAGVSNVLNPTVASIWTNTDRSLTSGVTMDSGVTINAGIYSGVTVGGVMRLYLDQGGVTVGWISSGVTVGSETEHKQLRMALGLTGTSMPTAGNGLLDFVHKISGGRWKIFDSGVSDNQMVFYEDDNTTVLAVFNLLDVDAGATNQSVYERTRD